MCLPVTYRDGLRQVEEGLLAAAAGGRVRVLLVDGVLQVQVAGEVTQLQAVSQRRQAGQHRADAPAAGRRPSSSTRSRGLVVTDSCISSSARSGDWWFTDSCISSSTRSTDWWSQTAVSAPPPGPETGGHRQLYQLLHQVQRLAVTDRELKPAA